MESLEARHLLASDWQNPYTSLDVNFDGPVTPIDALLVINTINQDGAGALPFLGGEAPDAYLDTNGDQVLSPIDALLVINIINFDDQAPVIEGSLLRDTAPGGTTNADRRTFDSSITGVATDERGVGKVLATIDGASTAEIAVAPTGKFEFVPVGLADGPHSVRLQALDPYGEPSNVFELSFELDTTPPPPTTMGLSRSSDTGDVGDLVTTAQVITLNGEAAGDSDVRLLSTGEVSRASHDGRFGFSGVKLAGPANVLTARVEDSVGNVADTTITIQRVAPLPGSEPDAVTFWMGEVLEAIRQDATTPPVASRNMAMVSLAIHDVISAFDDVPSYYVALIPPADASLEAAVAGAADRILRDVYPGQLTVRDAALARTLAGIPDGAPKADGLEFGRSVADAILSIRRSDGWLDFVDYRPDSDIGDWQPTEPMYDVALLPQWADLTPFSLASPDQFRPPGPPALEGTEYAAAYNEVKQFGRATDSSRTAEQTTIARFWADGPGTYTPPGHWNQIALELAEDRGLGLADRSSLFARLNVALADAAIVAWDAKYAYELWRPITAIDQANSDGNPSTETDPGWRPLLLTPPFPEYVSGHSTFSAAAAAILGAILEEPLAFQTTSLGLPGVERSFGSLEEAATEAGQSRIYGGIHFQFANQDGQAAGRAVANHVLESFSRTADTRAPFVVFPNHVSPVMAAENVQIFGQVIDSLSGAATLEVQVDNAPFQILSFDELGRFTFATNFATDGSQDANHTVRFKATDFAGNASVPATLVVELDTRDPLLTITSPTDQGELGIAPVLRGVVDGTGSSIVSLTYRANDGSPRPIPFDPDTGEFSTPLDISRIEPGSVNWSIRAQDAAGNEVAVSLTSSLTQRIPLAVTSLVPENGAAEVGTTYRPQLSFSRPIDIESLNDGNFFAMSPSHTKIPATVVPALDGSFAWLFFTTALPAASRITVHVIGDSIRSADGTSLDADGDGVPGGQLQQAFTTVNLTPVLGTTLTGIVLDPGPDLKPMTRDDVLAGADGIPYTADDRYLRPLEGVKVFLVGREEEAVLTDPQGRFEFAASPTGNVKLAIDGRTATNAAEGYFFPEMVMDLSIAAGRVNTVMGSMGTAEEMAANAARPEVYLPRIATDSLKSVSDTQPTIIGLDAVSATNLTAAQRSLLTLEVQPGSVVGADGQSLDDARVGVSMVPPELVREMLPPGVLQHTFDITIQAPDAAVFAVPLELTFPNVFGAAPGTQLNFLSFDHTTGRLVIEGTATVSADGRSVVTDPGNGITKPGWHGLTPPGSRITEDDESTEEGDELPPVSVTGVSTLFLADGQESTITIRNDGTPGEHKKTHVSIQLPGISAFAPGLQSSVQFDLFPGKLRKIVLTSRGLMESDLSRMAGAHTAGELFSGRVMVKATAANEGATETVAERTLYYGRFFSGFDELERDGILFPPTVSGVAREATIALTGPQEASFTLEVQTGGDQFTVAEPSGDSNASVTFSPVFGGQDAQLAKIVTGSLRVQDPDGHTLGNISLEAHYRPATRIFVNRDDLKAVFEILQRRASVTVGERILFDTDAEQLAVAADVEARIQHLFSPFGNAVELANEPGPNTVSVNWRSSLEVNSTRGGDAQGELNDTDPGDGVCTTGRQITVNELLASECTLRAALQEANTHSGLDIITFGIPQDDPGFDAGTGTYTIAPQSALPRILDPVLLDGTTQPGFHGVPIVELAGHLAGEDADGLVIQTGDSLVKGFIVRSFRGNGIVLDGADAARNRIQTNLIGTDFTGLAAAGNFGVGVLVTNQAHENIIGTDADGSEDHQEGNVIGGNHAGGIRIAGEDTNRNVVAANWIGTDRNGTVDLFNGLTGNLDAVNGVRTSETIRLTDPSFVGDLTGRVITLTSGKSRGERRVILSHTANTIEVDTYNAFGRTSLELVTAAENRNPVPGESFIVHGDGVSIVNGSFNTIGGDQVEYGNTIAFNAGAGVSVLRSENVALLGAANAILSNRIYANGEIGIDLGRDGFTPNDNVVFGDAGGDRVVMGFDTDQGANQLLNYPELAIMSDGRIQGTLHTAPNRQYRLEFFSSPSSDVDGQGFVEGRTFLAAMNVSTRSEGNNQGFESFIAPPAVTASKGVITATATAIVDASAGEYGETSEMSAPARSIRRGVTVVTHGFQIDGNGDSLGFLSEAIFNRTGGTYHDYDQQPGLAPIDALGDSVLSSSRIKTAVVPSVAQHGPERDETILLFDWGNESNDNSSGWGEHAGDSLFAMLVGLGLVNPAEPQNNPTLHFIAHSFGTAVTSEAIERLARYGIAVEQVTYLDPHDFDQANLPVDDAQRLFTLGQPQVDSLTGYAGEEPNDKNGYGAAVWCNVDFADAYYEVRGSNDGSVTLDFAVPMSRPIPGAYNRYLDDGDELPRLSLLPYPVGAAGAGGDHSYIHNVFYVATINGVIPAEISNELRPEDREVEFELGRTGYAYSRNGLLSTQRPAATFFQSEAEPQSHVNSSHVLVNRSTGAPHEPGLAALDALVPETVSPGPDALTNIRWAPRVDPLVIYNGDFETGGGLLDFVTTPGWSIQGGGGEGLIQSEDNPGAPGGTNQFLNLSDAFGIGNQPSKTHNLMYIPQRPDLRLAIDIRNATSNESGLLKISFGTFELGSVFVPATSSFVTREIDIPASIQNQAHTLELEISGGQADIDNLRFVAPPDPSAPSNPCTPGGSGESPSPAFGPAVGEPEDTSETTGTARSGPDSRLGESSPSGQLVDSAVTGDGVDDAQAIRDAVDRAGRLISTAAEEFVLATALNRSLRSNIVVFVDNHLGSVAELTPEQLVHALASTASHEIAHTLGAVNTGVVSLDANAVEQIEREMLPGGRTDLLLAGRIDNGGDLEFRSGLSKEIVAIGLAGSWNSDDAEKAINAFAQHLARNGVQAFDSTSDESLANSNGSIPKYSIGVFGPDLRALSGDKIDLGNVSLDGPGGISTTTLLNLANLGAADLVVESIRVEDATGSFHVTEVPSDRRILSGRSNQAPGILPLEITFDPTNGSGPIDATLQLLFQGDAPRREIRLKGFGLSSEGDIRIDVENNNLGGIPLSGAPHRKTGFATIRNVGAGALSISNILLDAAGLGQFRAANLTAGLGPDSPLVINPGATFSLDLTFDPSVLGLQRGEIQILSSDPQTPVLRQSLLGTGLPDDGAVPDLGNDFVLLETPQLSGTASLRGRRDPGGGFEFFVPADAVYHFASFDVASGLIAHAYGVTAPSGESTALGSPVYLPSQEPDGDGDGLPDDIERVIGTSIRQTDTDGDGIQDYVEIQQGLDPLGGRAFPTGIVAALSLQGESKEVFVEASPDAQRRIAYLATGTHGLAIVDVTRFDAPILLSELDLPGDQTDVAVAADRQLAVVAGGTGGLHLVDISDPTRPILTRTVELTDGASRVELHDGTAFVTSGRSLVRVDLTSDETQRLTFSATLTDVVREGEAVFTMDSNQVLRSFDISDFEWIERDSLVLPDGGAKLFVGDGIAFVPAANNAFGGFATVDIHTPSDLVLISGSDSATGLARTAFASNGAGRGLLVGATSPASGAVNAVDLLDISASPPVDTDAFLTRFVLPAAPNSVVIGDGFGFVATGGAGLQIVNYLAFDTQDAPPTVSLVSPLQDLDAGAPGVQIVEGATVPLRATVADDVQVSRVEFLVNGELAHTDVSFPFEGTTRAPTIDSAGAIVIIEARAVDTGGNSTLSNALEFDVVPDTLPPTVGLVTPSDGEQLAPGLRTVRVRFSEAIASTSVTAAAFQLRDEASQVVAPLGMELRSGDRTVQLTYAPLAPGDYELVIDAPEVTDRAGNPLGASDVISRFTLIDADVFWIGGSGRWRDGANWNTGSPPQATDDVLISVPGEITVTLDSSDQIIVNRLTSDERIEIKGASKLELAGTSMLRGGFDLLQHNGNRLHGADITVSGSSSWEAGSISGKLTNLGELTLNHLFSSVRSLGDSASSQSGTLENQGTINDFAGLSFNTGTVHNRSGANYNIVGAIGGLFNISGANTLINSGTLSRSAENDSITIGIPATNDGGTLEVQTGELSFDDGLAVTGGSVNVRSNARLQLRGGTFTFDVDSSTTGSADSTIEIGQFNDAITMTMNGGLDSLGTVTLNDATLNLNSAAAVAAIQLNDGTLTGTGSLVASGNSLWSATAVSLAGGLINTGTMTIPDPFAISVLATTLTNSGTFVHSGRLDLNNGSIVNQVTGVYEMRPNGGLNQGAGTNRFDNSGTLMRATGTETATISVPFTNTGIVEFASGTLAFTSTWTQTAGTTRLTGGRLNSTQTIDIQGGTLEGAGTINGRVSNGGTVRPGTSPGLLTVTGNYSQTATGTLQLEIGGLTAGSEFDRLAVGGVATLAGMLDIQLAASFEPDTGNSFQVMTFASRSGAFTTIEGLELPNGKVFVPQFNATHLALNTATALHASGESPSDRSESSSAEVESVELTQVQLDRLFASVIDRLDTAGSFANEPFDRGEVTVELSDLPGMVLGATWGHTIVIDVNAAGFEWFVDTTPSDDWEFDSNGMADRGGASHARMDLFSVLAHELGHLVGERHSEDSDHWMFARLAPGIRRLPEAGAVDAVFRELR